MRPCARLAVLCLAVAAAAARRVAPSPSELPSALGAVPGAALQRTRRRASWPLVAVATAAVHGVNALPLREGPQALRGGALGVASARTRGFTATWSDPYEVAPNLPDLEREEVLPQDAAAGELMTGATEPAGAAVAARAAAAPRKALWLPALKKICPDAAAKRWQANALTGTTRSGVKLDIEVLEMKSSADVTAALDTAVACSGGELVEYIQIKSVALIPGTSRAERIRSDLIEEDDEERLNAAGGPSSEEELASTRLGGKAPDAVFLLSEGGHDELADILVWEGNQGIPMDARYRILIQVLRGLVQMEEAGYQHRGLDPRKIKVFGDCASPFGCDVKLGGLSYAVPLSEEGPAETWGSSPAYVAPEVWAGKDNLGKADVWSVGMLAYELFCGGNPIGLGGGGVDGDFTLTDHPFKTRTAMWKFKNDERLLAFEEVDRGSREMGHLIRSMLRRTVRWRPTAKQALKSAVRIAQRQGIEVPERPAPGARRAAA